MELLPYTILNGSGYLTKTDTYSTRFWKMCWNILKTIKMCCTITVGGAKLFHNLGSTGALPRRII